MSFTIKVYDKGGTLIRSFGLYNQRAFDKKISELMAEGHMILNRTASYAKLVK